jgi:hypothetical protein
MKMKTIMIAALAAAQLSAAAFPARAAELPREEPAAQQRIAEGVEPRLADSQAPAPAVENAPESARALAPREDEPRKRKSTGDKVLTGAAVVLGIGALAVGGLLIAIFAN